MCAHRICPVPTWPAHRRRHSGGAVVRQRATVVVVAHLERLRLVEAALR